MLWVMRTGVTCGSQLRRLKKGAARKEGPGDPGLGELRSGQSPRQPRAAHRGQEPPPSCGRGSPGQGQRHACDDEGLESQIIQAEGTNLPSLLLGK